AVVLSSHEGALHPKLAIDAPIPNDIPADHVRVRVHAASLNPVDGKYDNWKGLMEREAGGSSQPFVLGLDGAGVIDALGSSVDSERWQIGSRVAFHLWLGRGDGSFAEYCVAHEGTLVRIPDNVTDETAAATPCAMWTAYKAVVTKLRAPPGASSIVVTSGSGGVGCFAVQLAKLLGINTIIATCSSTSSERVRELGATHCIDYHTENDIAAAIRRIVPSGVPYAVDSVSSDSATNLIASLAIDGELAAVAGSPCRDASITFLTGYSFHDVCLGFAAYQSGNVKRLLGDIGEACMKLLASGSIDPCIGRRVTLEELPEMIAKARDGISGGKVVVTIAP
ncbi:alcohol dehydrogenase, putative, partial [Bodo saltans]